jgi:DNA (cytosine-5)-methyltransferase 1
MKPEASPLVLSLFPGIGLLDMAFEQEGFCVVRGPDVLWGGDVRQFHPPAGKFDGVIGGPPCQLFSALRHLNPLAGQKHGNMIPEYERVVLEAQPDWFVMENVPDAPLANVGGFCVTRVLLRDAWVGGETSRLRVFSVGFREQRRLAVEVLALFQPNPYPAVCSDARVQPVALGGSGKRKRIPGVARTGPAYGPRLSLEDMIQRQGAPAGMFSDSPFTESAKRKMLGNGVPLPMGRAIAKAVRLALMPQERTA